LFNGSSDYLSLAASSQYNLTGSFTVECWFYLTATPPNNNNGTPSAALAIYWSTNLTGNQGFEFNVTTGSSGSIVFAKAGSGTGIFANYTSFALNSWYHVAVTYNGTTGAMYLNGISLPLTTNNWSWTIPSGTPILRVGGSVFAGGYNHYFPGYISNMRIVNGTAVYTGNFTPPTAPLTSITNTSLLILQDNRFKDNSTNNFTITRNGTPQVQAFKPFAQPAAYSVQTYGGSGYFNGTTDWLTASANAAYQMGTGAFTIECWVNTGSLNSGTTGKYIIGTYRYLPDNVDKGWVLLCNRTSNSSALQFSMLTAGTGVSLIYTGISSLPANTWNHVVVCRNGSSVCSMYLNGTRVATSSSFNVNDSHFRYVGLSGLISTIT
jgi:hypothetical protein